MRKLLFNLLFLLCPMLSYAEVQQRLLHCEGVERISEATDDVSATRKIELVVVGEVNSKNGLARKVNVLLTQKVMTQGEPEVFREWFPSSYVTYGTGTYLIQGDTPMEQFQMDLHFGAGTERSPYKAVFRRQPSDSKNVKLITAPKFGMECIKHENVRFAF